MNTTVNYIVIDALSQILQKIVLWEDTSLLVMNSLYSSNHKKRRKNGIYKICVKNMAVGGFQTQYHYSKH